MDKAGAYAIQGRAGRYHSKNRGLLFQRGGIAARAPSCTASANSAGEMTRAHETKRAAAGAALGNKTCQRCFGEEVTSSLSSCGVETAAGGAACAVVVVGGGSSRIPPLNSRIPWPSPRITSGIFLPPNRISTISRTTPISIGLSNINAAVRCIRRKSISYLPFESSTAQLAEFLPAQRIPQIIPPAKSKTTQIRVRSRAIATSRESRADLLQYGPSGGFRVRRGRNRSADDQIIGPIANCFRRGRNSRLVVYFSFLLAVV